MTKIAENGWGLCIPDHLDVLGERVPRRDEPVHGERRRGLDAAATATKRQQR
jgi:hypothetical protein